MQITWQDPQREDRGVISLTSELVWFTLAEVMFLLFSVTLDPVKWMLCPTLWNAMKICIPAFPSVAKTEQSFACEFQWISYSILKYLLSWGPLSLYWEWHLSFKGNRNLVENGRSAEIVSFFLEKEKWCVGFIITNYSPVICLTSLTDKLVLSRSKCCK